MPVLNHANAASQNVKYGQPTTKNQQRSRYKHQSAGTEPKRKLQAGNRQKPIAKQVQAPNRTNGAEIEITGKQPPNTNHDAGTIAKSQERAKTQSKYRQETAKNRRNRAKTKLQAATAKNERRSRCAKLRNNNEAGTSTPNYRNGAEPGRQPQKQIQSPNHRNDKQAGKRKKATTKQLQATNRRNWPETEITARQPPKNNNEAAASTKQQKPETESTGRQPPKTNCEAGTSTTPQEQSRNGNYRRATAENNNEAATRTRLLEIIPLIIGWCWIRTFTNPLGTVSLSEIPFTIVLSPINPTIDSDNSVYKLYIYISGWWFQSLWKNMEVSWDYHSQYMESYKIHVPNHQPV